MNLNFDTATLTPTEAQAAILLLSTLFPSAQIPSTSKLSPTPQASADPSPTPGPTLVPTSDPSPAEPTRRGRKAKDAPADPTQGSGVQTAAASDTTGPAIVSSATAPAGEAKPITADELRTLLNGYIKKHGMDEAIAQLKKFGCNRVTEALALDPIKLNELASALDA